MLAWSIGPNSHLQPGQGTDSRGTDVFDRRHANQSSLFDESTDYLDRAVPLHIYTDMSHYVKLSRCSLVVNRGLDPGRIAGVGKELQAAFSETTQKKLSPEKLKQTARNCFTKDRFGTLGLLESWSVQGWWGDLAPPILNELKARLN